MEFKSNDVQTRKFSSEQPNSQITQDCCEEIANCSASQPTNVTNGNFFQTTIAISWPPFPFPFSFPRI